MSTVVRKGIIELELRAVKARLDSPQIDAAARAYKEVEKAQTETAKATQEVAKQTQAASKVSQDFGLKSVAAFREAGEGAFRLMRGLTLLSAGGSDDLKKLVQHVALAQGAFDTFAGGFKMFQNLSGILGGPVTLAITGVTAAVTVGAAAWQRWQREAVEAAKAAEDRLDKLKQKAAEATRAGVESLDRRSRREQRLIEGALTPGERESRIRAEIQRQEEAAARIRPFAGSQQFAAGGNQAILDATRAMVASSQRQADLQRDLYDIQKQQMDAAKESMQRLTSMGAQGAAATGFGFGITGFATQGAQTASAALFAQMDAQTTAMARQFQELIDKLIDVIHFETQRADAMQKGLESAQSK